MQSDDTMKTGYKIALLGGVIVALITYLSFTNNPTMGVSLLIILPFLLCPIACGVAGGAMWFFNRSKKHHDLIKADKRKS